jgi:cobalamin biosynthesis protein CobC
MQSLSRHDTDAVTDHGGSLGNAGTRFPHAPRPWLDFSTGINARSYLVPSIPASAFERLPEESDLAALADAAARCYGAPAGGNVVCAPGTQILLPQVMGLVPQGRASILSPTYAEHARAAALCGHSVREVSSLDALRDADVAVVVNPNNPDGKTSGRNQLLDLANVLHERGGLLVVDEAFMDVGSQEHAVDGDVEHCGIVVLRSFGKFFGLAGLRLGFAITDSGRAKTMRGMLGPWAVSGPALVAGQAALRDTAWQAEMRADLAARAARLDEVLAAAGLAAAGGTTLFRLVRHLRAAEMVEWLGRAGIIVRAFSHDRTLIRFGVPAEDGDFDRLDAALSAWRASA